MNLRDRIGIGFRNHLPPVLMAGIRFQSLLVGLRSLGVLFGAKIRNAQQRIGIRAGLFFTKRFQ